MFDFQMLKDPGYFRENRLAAHSDHAYYLSEAERDSGRMSLRESLNGLWKFFYAQNPGQVIPGFESAEYDLQTARAMLETKRYLYVVLCAIRRSRKR